MIGILNIFLLWILLPLMIILIGNSDAPEPQSDQRSIKNLFKLKTTKKEPIIQIKQDETIGIEEQKIEKQENKIVEKNTNKNLEEEEKINSNEENLDDIEIVCQPEYEEPVNIEDIPPNYVDLINIPVEEEVVESSIESREPWHEVLKANNISFGPDFYKDIKNKEFKIKESKY